MTRNHLVVALAALGFGGLVGCGHAAVAVTPPVVDVPAVVAADPTPPPPPPAKLATVCDAVIGPAGHLKFPNEVEFESGKASLKNTPTTNAILQCLVDFLNNNKMVTKFRLEGHTDNAGDANANMTLSQARADAVLNWMSTHGAENGRLVSKGWGPTKPVEKNDTPEHMAMNRRVEFWIGEINGVQATKDLIAQAENPPAVAVVAAPAPAVVGVAVPSVSVTAPAIKAPSVSVAVPSSVSVGVGVGTKK
jgi:outer membrane protein OmpA-like peptidoglycan-associated protein